MLQDQTKHYNIESTHTILYCFNKKDRKMQTKTIGGVNKISSKPKLRRQDFVFENGWFETMVKMPGSLHMQQFQISDCEECNIYLLDSNAGVYIDDSKFCKIFVGPSESSVFVRDCHFLTIICCTKQFRMRDCTNCNIMLWCQSQPIIESSHTLTFRTFPAEIYPEIALQFKQAGLSTVWDNNWFDIYDFTPTKFQMELNTLCNHRCVYEHDRGDTASKEDQKFIQMFQEKIRQVGLDLVDDVIPRCLSTLGVDVTGYFILMVQPVPEIGLGLFSLHSRVALCPKDLLHKLAERQKTEKVLFAKIVPAWLGKWQKQVGDKIIAVLQQKGEKEVAEVGVFVPFGDQH